MPSIRIGLAGGVSGSGTIAAVPLLPRIIPTRQDFVKGAGYQATYNITQSQNGILSKPFSTAKIQTLLPVEVTFPNGRPVYDNLFPRTESHRITATINAAGIATLSGAPWSGYTQPLRIHYMYKMDPDETCASYVHEDIIVTSEFAFEGNVIGPQAATIDGIARYYDTSGKVLKDSPVTISDAGVMALVAGGDVLIGGTSISPIKQYTCDIGTAVGDVVYPSTTVDNKVIVRGNVSLYFYISNKPGRDTIFDFPFDIYALFGGLCIPIPYTIVR